jgi:GT2 family glycosyltransferase
VSATVDIIIPTFNQGALTAACFASIARTTQPDQVRLIWVDNGSAPAERDEMIVALEHSELPCLRLALPENLGFIKATNAGIAVSTAPFVLLLNNDTEVVPHWLDRMLDVMYARPKVGLVGARSSSPADHAARSEQPAPGYVVLKDKSMLPFFCVLIRREVIVQCGYLSEEFRQGFGDDDDYSRRAQAAGWQLARRTDVEVLHHHRTTFNAVYGGPAGWEPYRRENAALFYKKWHITPPKLPPLPQAPAVQVAPPRTLAAIATQPERLGKLERTLRSLRPQVTKLHVVLNGYTEPPAIVQELADEWVCVPGNDDRAGAKFRWSETFGGLYLTCDDDILYPPDYAAVVRQWVRRWKGQAVVTFHGRIVAPRALHVNEVVGPYVGCFLSLPEGRWINYPGSGVMGWDTRLGVPAHFDFQYDEEALVSRWAQERHIPIWAAPHEKGWIVDQNKPQDPASWKVEKADDWKRANAIVVPWAKEHGWAVHRAK